MTLTTTVQNAPAGHHFDRLKGNSVGLAGVLFMVIATASPITAMVGNVPISVGFGNGQYTPAGYVVATLILTLFAIGYAQMARHISATGAFYGFITRGLGPVAGLACGVTVTLTYVVFEPAIVGIFAFFAADLVKELSGLQLSWLWFAAFLLLAGGVLSYFEIALAAKVLGVCLILEVLMLTLLSGAVLFAGGGPAGLVPESLNPARAFEAAAGVSGASAGIGLFFAFWSWVGFESSAMYSEESRNPRRNIPIAVIFSALGVGLFYVFVSWMVVAANGPAEAIRIAQDPATAANLFFDPTRRFLGEWAVSLFKVLIVTGTFACALAFHNCAARYLYALGRENLLPGTAAALGRTHSQHGSPHRASTVQTVLASVIVLLFFAAGKDPYADLFTLLGLLGTLGILVVQALCAFAVIVYFHRVPGPHQQDKHWFKTLLAPLLGGLGLVYVVDLLFTNMTFAAGNAAQSTLFQLIPWIIAASLLAGALLALYFRRNDPARYRLIGQLVRAEP